MALDGALDDAPQVGAGLSGGLVGASFLSGIGAAGVGVGIGLLVWVDSLPRCTSWCLFHLFGEWIAASVTLGASGLAALIGLIWLGVELDQREAALRSRRRASGPSVTLDAAVGPDRGVLFVRGRF
ncbi:MAG: hypothetical protein M5U28_25075 [Sandaracinaceae bacterium]|nr:hypothetical protein [Sandaracinaceae bacterium]